MKQKTIFRLSLIVAVCGLLILQSCETDPVTPPVDNTTNVKPYIMVKGFKSVSYTHLTLPTNREV